MGQRVHKDYKIISVIIYDVIGDDVGIIFKSNGGHLRLYNYNKNYNKICKHIKLNVVLNFKIYPYHGCYIIKNIVI
jgi:hypothetical protein